MIRTALVALFLLVFCFPVVSPADDNLTILESVDATGIQVQPGLLNYHARIETSRIREMMTRLTKGMPDDVQAPSEPVIYKFWQSSGKGIVYADSNGLAPFVDKMVKQVTSHLAIELNRILLPEDRAEQRKLLAKKAKVKTTEVALDSNTIRQVEIAFESPTDLDEAFYVAGLRLPQKQVTMLAFDIDSGMNTVNEMKVSTADGLHLTLEIRYLELPGGYIPERFQATSPDGKIDDLFQVTFTEVDGFKVPSSMNRKIRRPNLQEDLEILFKDYRINQPISADIQKRLDEQ